jgi:hypothetical protein
LLDFSRGRGVQDFDVLPDGIGGVLNALQLDLGVRIPGVQKHGDGRRAWDQIAQQSEPLGISLVKIWTPVTLPPGWLKLATKPLRIRSPPDRNTIGMLEETVLTTCADRLLPTITSTGRWPVPPPTRPADHFALLPSDTRW